MNGLTISELRAVGTSVRHQSGVNTCVRCLQHFFQKPHAEDEEEACWIHTADLKPMSEAEPLRLAYPCCARESGTRGCVAATHLPLFQNIEGKIMPNRRIQYDAKMDLHVGRWVSTRVSVQQLNKDAAAGSSSSSSSAPSSSPSSVRSPDSLPAASAGSPTAIPSIPGNLGQPVQRLGDEIMVCGQLYHTGTPVILWGDVGGYDHYRVERRFCPFAEADWATTQQEVPSFSTPNRFGLRKNGLSDADIERVRGGQWDLPTLSKQMKSFVLHYDEAGLSQQCFEILQDQRDLSIHFMCDLDGTIYQALDLKERAWDATTANTSSVGCEIANVGAYDPSGPNPFDLWYAKNNAGETIIAINPALYPNNGSIHTPGFVGSPARPNPIPGMIQGQNLIQYDYTPQQYAALSKLIATFCTIFPTIPPTYPVDASGQLIRQKLPDATLLTYTGLLGHYHIQTDKIDPGPAMQWDVISQGAKTIMEQAKKELAAKKDQSSSSSSSPSSSSAAELNLMRKLERKVFQAADDVSSSTFRESDPFFLVESGWWGRWKSWLSSSGDAARPGPVTNLSLLSENDHRTPRAGLKFDRDYKALHERVWKEIVDLYDTDATIVRATADIYGLKPGAAAAPVAENKKHVAVSSSVAAPLPVAVPVQAKPIVAAPSAPAPVAAPAAASSSAPAASNFVVPVISSDEDGETWIVVSKRS